MPNDQSTPISEVASAEPIPGGSSKVGHFQPPVFPASRSSIVISVEKGDLPFLQRMPWYKPLAEWKNHEARFIPVKSGLSRHTVRFVRIRRRAFAIKETSAETAEKEFSSYTRLRRAGIPTLLPIGTVVRDDGVAAVETEVGAQLERRSTGYVITQLLEYSIPHYYLFRRAFRKTNRLRMWDTIVRLFVQLHCKGVYWGDASLSNMMMVFAKEHLPEVGIRTVLQAVLADAETVEFQPQLSTPMRLADVENFLESMAWTEADLKASGTLRDPLMTEEDKLYILARYRDLFEIEREEQTFGVITSIDVDKLLGPFQARGQSKALLQHIYEHKWYLSERDGKEITIEEAARDWYLDVFKPVLMLFGEFSILDDFPERTAASLYLDIMLHKYYLSEKVG
ncbi:MAG TPA: hypothetical protein VGR15_04960, partial [Bacteroidota bacterium]|nr:hypothetical protein [Bacteroidota bacterium]